MDNGSSLRPYQQRAVEAITQEWESGNRRTLCVMATGLGKTVTFAALAKQEAKAGRRVLILAHRGELLDQAADKIKRFTGLSCAYEKAEQSSIHAWQFVTVGSVQSLQQTKRLEQFPPDHWDTIIVDEAHHVLSDGYQKVLNHFDQAKVLGVTATPDRGDMRNLGQYFDSCAFEYGIDKGIKDGYLCPIVAETIPLNIDLTEVRTQSGDYAVGDLGQALDPYLDAIATAMVDRCKGRKTVVFLPLIATSQKFQRILIEHGFKAGEVNGNSPDRAEILSDFASGKYDVLCNSMLLTEGWDCPTVDCIIVLRPTQVRSLYVQMVGRGLRLADGKKNCLILDFLWMTSRHNLIHPAGIIAKSQEIADKATKIIENTDGCIDLDEVLEQAESDVIRERENALAQQLKEMRKRKGKLVDPLQYAVSISAEDLIDYEPLTLSEMAPPTQKQLELLEKRGIFPDEIKTAGHAKMLIDRLIARQAQSLATPKQIRLLEGRGFMHVGTWQFEAASNMIGRIAANGWIVPREINPSTYEPPKIIVDDPVSPW